jgi:hypothetical protein
MFSLANAVEEKFDSFDETLAFVSEEKRRIMTRKFQKTGEKSSAYLMPLKPYHSV